MGGEAILQIHKIHAQHGRRSYTSNTQGTRQREYFNLNLC